MDKYKETLNTWNKVASLYQDKFMDLEIYNESYDLLCQSLSNHQTSILEIGCGPGNITKYLLSKRPDFLVLGTDISPAMIKLAQKNNPTAQYKIMDCREIHELKQSFDGIVGGFCLPYISPDECKKLISTAAGLLNQKGVIYLSFVEGEPEASGYQTTTSGDRTFFYYHDLEKLKSLLIHNQFEIIKVMKVTYAPSERLKEMHTLLIARKK